LSVPNRLRKAAAVLFVFGLIAAACSDNGNDETTGGTTTAGGTTSGSGGTSAPAKQYTIGFTNPIASNDQLHTLQEAIEARAEAMGSKVISLDDNLDVNKQISDIDQLVTQKVDAIIVFPLDPNAITPAVERAQAAGIKTIGINATLGNEGAADAKPFDAAVNQGEKEMAEGTAQFVIDQLGGKGNVLGIGLGIPVPTIEYQMQVMEDEVTKGGLKWLDRVDNPTDDAAGAQPVVEQALLRFPDVNAIMAYNDPSALGAVAAVKASDQQGDIVITGANGVALDQVRSGDIALSYDLLPWVQGICYVNVITDLLTGADVPVTTTAPVQQITADTVDDVQPWDDAIAKIKSGEYTKCAPPDQQ